MVRFVPRDGEDVAVKVFVEFCIRLGDFAEKTTKRAFRCAKYTIPIAKFVDFAHCKKNGNIVK